MELAEWLDWLRNLPPIAAWAALGAAALVEYLFPPFPGDTVVLAGAVLVGLFGWPALPVLGAVTAGAVVGSAIDFQLGLWLVRSGRIERMAPGRRAAVERIAGRFRDRGAIYLALNRFVPGVRALFFVAAGLASLRWGPVLLWSTVSALVWNALLVGAGVALGANLETLETWFGRYNLIVGVVVVAVILGIGAQVWREVQGGGEASE